MAQPLEVPARVDHELLTFDQDIVIKEPGYVYIYYSNENETNVEVFFDDFTVEHVHEKVVQQEDYYPFGLTYNSYQRENSLKNKFKFQGQEYIDDLNLGWDSFKWRNHQPNIGRFFNVDPLASDYVYNSPYAFSENKVTNHVELEGLEARPARNRYQSMQNYRSLVRRELIRTSYEYSNRELKEGQREPLIIRPTMQGKIAEGLLNLGSSLGLEGKLKDLQLKLSVDKNEIVNTNGAGFTSSEGSKFVFSGPDAGNLEALENAYQTKANDLFGERFAEFAANKSGVDFNSLSPEDQEKFMAENGPAAALIRSTVGMELGPSPKEIVLKAIEGLKQEGLVVEKVKRDDLPVIRQGQ